MDSLWTAEKETRVREMYAEGCSNTHIANELGMTRNAVAGKKARLGLTKRGTRQSRYRIKSRGMSEYDVVRKIKFKKIVLLTSTDQTKPRKIGFMKRKDNQCAWVLDEKGKDGLALYCGHKTHDDESYCFSHCCIVFTRFACQSIAAE